MIATNQTFLMVRNPCPGLSSFHINLTNFGQFLLQKFAHFFNVSDRSLEGKFSDHGIVSTANLTIHTTTASFQNLNDKKFSLGHINSVAPFSTFISIGTCMVAPAHSGKRCLHDKN
jgi:hypothetical protein